MALRKRKRADGALVSASELLTDFLAYRPKLTAALRRYVSAQDTEDILQEAFLRTYEASQAHQIRHPKSFLYKTGINLALNRLQRAESRLTHSVADFSSYDVSEINETLESRLDSERRFSEFCRAVGMLPRQCRHVFILKKVFGFSQCEIATTLGLSESTVEKHVAKGLLFCRRRLLGQSPER